MVQAGELTPLFAGIIDINWDSPYKILLFCLCYYS